MSTRAEAVVPVLLVEPEMSAQLDGLDAVREAHARVELACVATCGGAGHALDRAHFDCLLLSTYLCLYPDERHDLNALVRRARACGVALVAFGPGDAAVLGVPVHDTLTYQDVAAGKMDETLARARARAELERRFTSGVTGLTPAATRAR
jgi:hypothetical protein